MQGRIDQTGAAPAEALGEQSAERPATVLEKPPNSVRLVIGAPPPRHRACRAPRTPRRTAPSPCRHRAAPSRPDTPANSARADHRKPRRVKQRRQRQHRPPAVAVDEGADPRRNQPCHQESDRGAADHQNSDQPVSATIGRPAPPESRTRCPSRRSGQCRAAMVTGRDALMGIKGRSQARQPNGTRNSGPTANPYRTCGIAKNAEKPNCDESLHGDKYHPIRFFSQKLIIPVTMRRRILPRPYGLTNVVIGMHFMQSCIAT